MAGLLGFLAAGVAKGAGAGIVAEAKAKREAAIAELENSRLLSREATDREFRSKEGQLDRNARLSESQADRDFRAKEGELDRTSRADLTRMGQEETITGEGGELLVRSGDKTRRVTDEAGKPVKALSKTSDTPADVRTAEWLITKGIVKTPEEAWKYVRQTRGSDATPMEIEKMVETAVKTELGDSIGAPDPKAVEESRTRNRDRILKGLGIGETEADADSSKTTTAATARPEGMSDAQAIDEARKAIKLGAPPEMVRKRLQDAGIDPDKAGL
ncbi:hypothetical protein ASG43_03260 [Aureimonas sp. Leaf454]|uniref:hypothetical protein n=1 Tax=Aureimonas sp. Leaf454 TaxID=1736381 RepID=UPI0006F44EC3|nr:hypothetical protein [Aureimonas sp. Leaf454]KQT54618.1 hypothetical protein ASG43_03260 [Aureimonas sp. Leaf454]